MAISLRILMSGAIALVTVISALVAFLPTYEASVSGVRSSLLDLRRAYVGRAQNQTQSFLDSPTTILETLRLEASRGIITFNIGLPAERARWIAWLYDTTTRYPDLLNKASLVVPLALNPQYFETDLISCTNELVPFFGPSFATVASLMNLSDRTIYFRSINASGMLTSADPTGGNVVPANEGAMMITPYRLMREDPSATLRWFPARAGLSGPELHLSGLMRDPSGSLMAGVTLILLNSNFQALLQSLGLRSRARAFAVDTQTSIVVGFSTAETTATWYALFDPTKQDWERMALKTPSNVTDPLIREVVRTVGEDLLLNAPAPFNQIVKTHYGRTYLDVLEVTAPGLRLRTVLIMPELDFLEDVFKMQQATVGGVAGAIAVMIALAFLLGHVLTAPFLRLRDRMYLTASLQDDSEADSPSILTEVRGMQRSYSMMRSELAKVKTYLPQSVLAALQRNASDSAEDVEDDDEGEVSARGTPPLSRSVLSRSALSQEGGAEPGVVAGGQGMNLTGTSRSRSSSRSSGRSSRNGVTATTVLLNTSASLTHRRVTVLCFNLRGFNSYCLASTPGEVAAAESRLVERVSQHVAKSRGVIDLFHGDRLQASFNAVTPCAGHIERGALAALSVVRDLARDQPSFHVTAGLSVGNCSAGNVGSSTLKRFCVLGDAVPQAAALERMCRLFGASVLCPSMMFQDLSLELLLRSVGIVHLPGQSAPRVIGSIEGMKSLKVDEWMYQLKEGEDSDPFALPNSFFAAAAEGNTELASSIAEKLRGRHEEAAVSSMLPQAEIMLSSIASGSLPTTDTSPYYLRCVARVEPK